MTDDSHELEVALFDFRARFAADSAHGRVADVDSYARRFPGFETQIRAAYACLIRGESIDEAEIDGRAPAPPTTQERRIAHYRLLHELGRGGQGSVHLAEDTRLHRRVAIKLLAGLAQFSSDARRRFQREAETASRLDHPCICTVYESGVDDGTAYIAMRYVEGESLGRRIARARDTRAKLDAEPVSKRRDARTDPDSFFPCAPASRDDLWACLHFFESAARALHVAHEAGIVHRDVKPGNLMITTERTPVVLDFGLAREAEPGAEAITLSGEIQGTPAYLSPEQLEPKGRRLDRRTDVYSLGVALYECLTLEAPFQAPTIAALYQQILRDPPRDPRTTNRSIPADLAVVLETALEKDRDRRYASALDLAEDLRRIREHEPIRARPPSLGLRALRWVQRHPAQTVGVCAGAFVLGALGLARFMWRAKAQSDRVEEITRAINGELSLGQSDERIRGQLLDWIGDVPMRALTPDWVAQARRHMGGFAEYGLPLDGALSPDAFRERIEVVRARDPDLADELIDGVYSLAIRLTSAAHQRDDLKTPDDLGRCAARSFPWDATRERLGQLISRLEDDRWRRAVWCAFLLHFESDSEDEYCSPQLEPFLTPAGWVDRSARDLVFLGDLAYVAGDSRGAVAAYGAAKARRSTSFPVLYATRLNGGIALRFTATGNARDPLLRSIIELEAARDLRPSCATVYLALAQTWERLGDADNALAHARRAVDLDASNSTALKLKAKLAPAGSDERRDAASAAWQIDPNDSEACSLRTRIALDAGRWFEALSISDWAVEHMASPADVATIAANRLCAGRGTLEIVTSLSTATLDDQQRARWSLEFARVLVRRRAFAEARALAEACIALQPSNADAYVVLGSICCEGADWDGAERAFRKAIECHPAGSEKYLGLATVWNGRRNPQRAIDELERALERDPAHVGLRTALVNLRRTTGGIDAAISAARAWTEACPTRAAAWVRLAELQVERGSTDDAAESFGRALHEQPEDAPASLGLRKLAAGSQARERVSRVVEELCARRSTSAAGKLARAYLEHSRGARELWEATLRELADERWSDPIPCTSLADFRQSVGDFAGAQAAAREALARSPAMVVAHWYLARALSDAGAWVDAVSAAIAGLELSPSHEKLLGVLGDAALQAGRPELALDAIAQNIAAHPANRGARLLRARVEAWQGGLQRARSELEDLVTADPKDERAAEQLYQLLAGERLWSDAMQLASSRARAARGDDAPDVWASRVEAYQSASSGERAPASLVETSATEPANSSGRGERAEVVAAARSLLERELPVVALTPDAEATVTSCAHNLVRGAEAGWSDGDSSDAAPGRAPSVESSTFAMRALDLLEALLDARLEDLGRDPPLRPRAVHRQALVDELLARDTLALRVPPRGAPWRQRALGYMSNVRAALSGGANSR